MNLSEKVGRVVTAVGLPHQVATCQVRSSWAGGYIFLCPLTQVQDLDIFGLDFKHMFNEYGQ